MQRILMSTLAAMLVLASGDAVMAQGKGKGQDKEKGPEKAQVKPDAHRGHDDARVAREVERAAKPAQKAEKRDRRDDRADVGNRGRSRSDEVREIGGDVAGPAPAAVLKREAKAEKREDKADRNAFKSAAKAGKYFRKFDPDDTPSAWRGYALSTRLPERYVARIAALALARGVPENVLLLRGSGDRMILTNPSGVVLLDLDDARARNMGGWQVVSLDDRDEKKGAPAFCRSGAGHPVWGRQWCVDKGFGLGGDGVQRWGRAVRVEDVIFRQQGTPTDLRREVLAAVLGDVVFNRLAAHAITLGLVDPLVGRWVTDPAGRRVLLVNSGTAPVAEVVDTNRDDRADLLLVALRPW